MSCRRRCRTAGPARRTFAGRQGLEHNLRFASVVDLDVLSARVLSVVIDVDFSCHYCPPSERADHVGLGATNPLRLRQTSDFVFPPHL